MWCRGRQECTHFTTLVGRGNPFLKGKTKFNAHINTTAALLPLPRVSTYDRHHASTRSRFATSWSSRPLTALGVPSVAVGRFNADRPGADGDPAAPPAALANRPPPAAPSSLSSKSSMKVTRGARRSTELGVLMAAAAAMAEPVVAAPVWDCDWDGVNAGFIALALALGGVLVMGAPAADATADVDDRVYRSNRRWKVIGI